MCFIVNPISGARKKDNFKKIIEDNLDHNIYSYEYIETKYRGHAAELSAEFSSQKVDVVVACGGDGTVNEVAGSLRHSESALAIIPRGSGNGFAMHIGMGRDSTKAIRKLNRALPKTIDSCTINGIFFINLAGIGFDAVVAHKIDTSTERGFKLYLNTIITEIRKYKAQKFRIHLDEEVIEGKFNIIAVANAAMYGYNFNIAPLAKLNDGLLDIVIIKDAPLLRTLASSWRMLNNTLDKSPLVQIKKSKEAIISLDKPYYYHIDGESMAFEGPLHFKVVPNSLTIMLPKERFSQV